MHKPVTLLPGGVEFLRWRTRGLPTLGAGAVAVSFDDGATWHPAERDGDEIRLLVAHPDTVAPASTAIVLPRGMSSMLVQLTDTPEVVIRPGGSIWA